MKSNNPSILNIIINNDSSNRKSKNKKIQEFNRIFDILIKEMSNQIKFGIIQKELEELLKSEAYINRIARKNQIFEDDNLFDAYKIGIIKSIIATVRYKDNTKTDDFDKYYILIDKDKHLYDLLSILYDEKYINHSMLAKSLNMSKSSLTNWVHKVENLGLFYYEKHGRYKFYYSNNKTKEVYIRYTDKRNKVKYSLSDFYNMIYMFIKVLDDEISKRHRVSFKNILRRLSLSEGICRNDINDAILDLTKTINNELTLGNEFIMRMNNIAVEEVFDYKKDYYISIKDQIDR